MVICISTPNVCSPEQGDDWSGHAGLGIRAGAAHLRNVKTQIDVQQHQSQTDVEVSITVEANIKKVIQVYICAVPIAWLA